MNYTLVALGQAISYVDRYGDVKDGESKKVIFFTRDSFEFVRKWAELELELDSGAFHEYEITTFINGIPDNDDCMDDDTNELWWGLRDDKERAKDRLRQQRIEQAAEDKLAKEKAAQEAAQEAAQNKAKQDAVAQREQDLAMLKIIQDRLGITQ